MFYAVKRKMEELERKRREEEKVNAARVFETKRKEIKALVTFSIFKTFFVF